MEARLGYTRDVGGNKIQFWPIYLCFILFGIMISFSKAEFTIITFLLSLLISVIIGVITINGLIIIFKSSNAELVQTNSQFAKEAVAEGMLFMVPFAVLAALAQFALGWDAVMPFASAAVMTACATAGAEVLKKGAIGAKNVMIPSAIAFLISTSWMLLVGILP